MMTTTPLRLIRVLITALFLLQSTSAQQPDTYGGDYYEQDDYSQDNLYHDYAMRQQQKEAAAAAGGGG